MTCLKIATGQNERVANKFIPPERTKPNWHDTTLGDAKTSQHTKCGVCPKVTQHISVCDHERVTAAVAHKEASQNQHGRWLLRHKPVRIKQNPVKMRL